MKRFIYPLVLGTMLCLTMSAYSQSTASANVQVMADAFVMPELGGRSRTIWIYLPLDYSTETTKRYPVFYMHDGQNLFDAETAYRKTEWQVDETLNALQQEGKTSGVIVVGINHGNDTGGPQYRDDEYVPWEKSNGEGGEGDLYVDFIINTLKPYVDSHYRTLTDRENTGIGGGSLGGYISLYAAIRNPEVFGAAAILSPAFWFNQEIMNYLRATPWSHDVRLYLVTSEEEGEESVNAFHEAYKSLRESGHGYRLIRKKLTPTGGHNEMYYREQFPEAFLWMFEPQHLTTGLDDLSPATAGGMVYPNPAWEQLHVILPEGWQGKAEAYFMDALGRHRTQPIPVTIGRPVSVAPLPAGLYYLVVFNAEQRIAIPVVKH